MKWSDIIHRLYLLNVCSGSCKTVKLSGSEKSSCHYLAFNTVKLNSESVSLQQTSLFFSVFLHTQFLGRLSGLQETEIMTILQSIKMYNTLRKTLSQLWNRLQAIWVWIAGDDVNAKPKIMIVSHMVRRQPSRAQSVQAYLCWSPLDRVKGCIQVMSPAAVCSRPSILAQGWLEPHTAWLQHAWKMLTCDENRSVRRARTGYCSAGSSPLLTAVVMKRTLKWLFFLLLNVNVWFSLCRVWH